MVGDQHHDSSALSMRLPLDGLEPDSAEFIAACLAVSNNAAVRGLQPPAQLSPLAHADPDLRTARSDTEPIAVRSRSDNDQARIRVELESAQAELQSAHAELQSAQAELQSAQAELRTAHAQLDSTRTEHTNLTVSLKETVAALEAASRRAGHDRVELAAAADTISARDSIISELRHNLAERDRDIAALQRHVLQAEEARIADATAIMESLDKYRT